MSWTAITNIASICSIAGFILTLLLLWRTKRLPLKIEQARCSAEVRIDLVDELITLLMNLTDGVSMDPYPASATSIKMNGLILRLCAPCLTVSRK